MEYRKDQNSGHYIIYVNDLLSSLRQSKGYAYADDTAIVVNHRCAETAIKIMQEEFNAVTAWCHDQGLVINAKKTKIMHIRPPHIQKAVLKIKMHDTNCLHNAGNHMQLKSDDSCEIFIENVSTYKYLGIIVDYNFKWSYHIRALETKLRQSTYALFHLSNVCTAEVLRQCYFGLVESHLRHGILAWGNAPQTQSLQQIQTRIHKIIHRVKTGQHYDRQQISSKTKLLNIEQLHKMEVISRFWNDNTYKIPVQHNFNTRRRQQGRYNIPRHWNEYGRRRYEVAVPKIFNELPSEFRNLSKPLLLKKAKQYFLNTE